VGSQKSGGGQPRCGVNFGPMRIPNPPDMKVRLSADLRQKIEFSARDNNRTMNAEIGARLEQSFRKEGRAVSLVSSPNLEERLD
jgi:hypothetical protein